MNKHLPTFSAERCAALRTSLVVSEKRKAHLAFLSAFSALLFWGPVGALQAQTTQVQFIHAAEGSLLDTVDVYVNQVLIVNDLARGYASGFLDDLPAQTGFPLQIALAPANSTSAADGFFAQSVFYLDGGLTMVAFVGDLASSGTPLQCAVDVYAQKVSSDTSKTAVSFLHAATGAGAVDAVLREGGMVFGNLGYAQFTPYLNLKPDDLFLDVKASGTSNILSTYRIFTSPYKGQAFRVVATGNMSSAASLRMFAVYSDGFVAPVDFAPVARVQYLNSLADTVDVYKNGTKFSNDAAPGAAMPYKYIPAGYPINISVSPYNSINGLNPFAKSVFTFENMKTYTAVSAGVRGDTLLPVNMFFHEASREKAIDTNSVSLLFFQGNPYWPKVDVRATGFNNLFSEVAYGSFKGYYHYKVASGPLKIQVYEFGTTNMIRDFANIDLSAYKGQSLTLFTKQGAQAGSTELWAAKADGKTVMLAGSVSADDLPVEQLGALVFPNPAASLLYVSLPQVKEGLSVHYKIVDISGRVLVQGEKDIFASDEKIQLDVSGLIAGVYFLNLGTSKATQTIHFQIHR